MLTRREHCVRRLLMFVIAYSQPFLLTKSETYRGGVLNLHHQKERIRHSTTLSDHHLRRITSSMILSSAFVSSEEEVFNPIE